MRLSLLALTASIVVPALTLPHPNRIGDGVVANSLSPNASIQYPPLKLERIPIAPPRHYPTSDAKVWKEAGSPDDTLALERRAWQVPRFRPRRPSPTQPQLGLATELAPPNSAGTAFKQWELDFLEHERKRHEDAASRGARGLADDFKPPGAFKEDHLAIVQRPGSSSGFSSPPLGPPQHLHTLSGSMRDQRGQSPAQGDASDYDSLQ